MTAGPVIVGVDGVQSTRDATALGRVLAEVLEAPLDVVTGFKGAPAHGLATAAQKEAASIVVLGATHHHSLARTLEGTARRLLRETPCPVAVAPVGFADRVAEPLRRIGIGYEPTPEAHEALMTADALATRVGAELHVIGVALPIVPLAIDDLRDWGPYVDDERRVVEGGLTRAIAQLPNGEIDRVTDPRIGDPAVELTAASQDLDLLVCGSRRRGPVRALMLGSITERLLRFAACPVLIVPRPASGAG